MLPYFITHFITTIYRENKFHNKRIKQSHVKDLTLGFAWNLFIQGEKKEDPKL